MNHISHMLFTCTAALLTSALLSGCALETQDDMANDGEVTAEESQLRNESADELAAGKADNGRCSGVVVPDRSGFHKRIALSFDDGPDSRLTPQVLDILDRYHAKAVFFEMGQHMVGKKALMQDILNRGHLIGSHTYSHPNMRSISHASAVSQVERTINVVKGMHLRAPGAHSDYTMGFFRFPYGSSNCDTADIVKSHGHIITGWHIDSADWCFGASRGGVGYCSPHTFGDSTLSGYRNNIVKYVEHQATRKGGGVLLFHDVHAYTVSVLPKILQTLVNDGFTFVRIDDTDTFPLLNGANPAERPWIGTNCNASNATCDYAVSGKSGFCQSTTAQGEGFCSLSCNGYCPDRYGAAPTFCASLDGGHTGVCVSKSSSLNHNCQDIPGTNEVIVDRFIGTSSASATTAAVCVPEAGNHQPPPATSAGSCTVTVHGGTRAFKSPSFSSDDWGTLPEGGTFELLDTELHAGAFYRIDPRISGAPDAYVWETKVSCQVND